MLRSILLGATTALLLAAGPASAASIEIAGDTLTLRGAGDEENWPSVSATSGGELSLTDMSAYITDWPGECSPDEAGESVICPMPDRYVARLEGGADNHNLSSSLPDTLAIELHGGPGDDHLDPFDPETGDPIGSERVAEGGDGNDVLSGSRGRDVLRGGPGDDTVLGYGSSDEVMGGDGNDRLSGDAGHQALNPVSEVAPDVVDGGPGVDVFTDYEQTNAAVKVTIDGQPGDGRPGEGDNLISVEDLQALAPGDWTLTEGDDKIYVHPRGGSSTVRGLGGNDRLEGGHERETLDGGPGDDHVEGGYGDDVLTGGPGRDRILGDEGDSQCGGGGQSCTTPYGNDTIDTRDGEADSVDCGWGDDRAYVDAIDTVALCEYVEKTGDQNQNQNQKQNQNQNQDTRPAAACKVPKVARLQLRIARRRVVAAGCRSKVKRIRHRRVKRGRVVRASRKAGLVVPAGTRLTLYVSDGKRARRR